MAAKSLCCLVLAVQNRGFSNTVGDTRGPSCPEGELSVDFEVEESQLRKIYLSHTVRVRRDRLGSRPELYLYRTIVWWTRC